MPIGYKLVFSHSPPIYTVYTIQLIYIVIFINLRTYIGESENSPQPIHHCRVAKVVLRLFDFNVKRPMKTENVQTWKKIQKSKRPRCCYLWNCCNCAAGSDNSICPAIKQTAQKTVFKQHLLFDGTNLIHFYNFRYFYISWWNVILWATCFF